MNTKYRQKLTRILFFIALLGYPLAASALGVGSLSVQSNLNQPLDAQIELLSTDGVDSSEINAALAKESIFERAGIDYSPALNSIALKISTHSNGTPYIEMSSQQPLQEPRIELILEVKWKQQRLLRKFTVTLEPVAPITKAPEPDQSPVPAVPHQSNVKQSVAQPANASIKVYEVKTNKDTLWSIATQFRPNKSYSMNQVMQEILKQNPSAFLNNNINRLKTGSTLRFDTTQLDQKIQKQTKKAPKQATQKRSTNKPSSTGEIKTHKVKSKETLWSIASKLRPDSTYGMKKVMNALLEQNPEAFHNNDISQLKKGSTLKLNVDLLGGASVTKVASSTDQTPTTPVAQVQTTPLPAPVDKQPEKHIPIQKDVTETQTVNETASSLIQAIDKIQQQIIEMQNSLKDKQNQLAQLEGEAQIHPETEIAPETMPIKPVISPEPAILETSIDRSSQEIITKQSDATKNIENNRAEIQMSSPVDVIEHADDQEKGFFSSSLLTGLGAAVLLGLAGFFLYRRSKKSDEDLGFDDELEDTVISTSEDQHPTFDQQLQQSQGLRENLQELEVVTDMESGKDVPLSSDLRTLYEADIYIACQRYSRAEESLINAIELDPERTEIRLKLLEVYFAAQDHEKFLSEAEVIHKKIGEHDPEWLNVVNMGQKLCPDELLFGGEISDDEIIFSEESVALSNDPMIQDEELQNDESPLNPDSSDDMFKAEHDSSIDLDESDLFAGHTNKNEEQDTDLSSIFMDDIENKDSSLNIAPDGHNKDKAIS